MSAFRFMCSYQHRAVFEPVCIRAALQRCRTGLEEIGALVPASVRHSRNHSAEMRRDRNHRNCRELHRKPNPRSRFARPSRRNPSRHDHHRRRHREQQMQAQRALQRRSFQLPLPRNHARDHHRKNGSRGNGEIVVRDCRPSPIALPQRQQIEEQRHEHQRDREMHQHNVLRMLCQQRVLQIEEMHGYFTTTFPTIFGCTEQ